MVGVNMAFRDAICECSEGTMLEPCLLKPCFHVAGESLARTSAAKCGFQICNQGPSFGLAQPEVTHNLLTKIILLRLLESELLGKSLWT